MHAPLNPVLRALLKLFVVYKWMKNFRRLNQKRYYYFIEKISTVMLDWLEPNDYKLPEL